VVAARSRSGKIKIGPPMKKACYNDQQKFERGEKKQKVWWGGTGNLVVVNVQKGEKELPQK